MKDVIEALKDRKLSVVVQPDGSGCFANGPVSVFQARGSWGPCADPLPRIRKYLGCKATEPAAPSLGDVVSAMQMDGREPVAVIYPNGSGVLREEFNHEAIGSWGPCDDPAPEILRQLGLTRPNETDPPPSTAPLQPDDSGKAPPLSSPELPFDRLVRLVAELEKRDGKEYSIVISPSSHPGDITSAVIPFTAWHAETAIAAILDDPIFPQLEQWDLTRCVALLADQIEAKLTPNPHLAIDRLIEAAEGMLAANCNWAAISEAGNLRRAIREAKRSLSAYRGADQQSSQP